MTRADYDALCSGPRAVCPACNRERDVVGGRGRRRIRRHGCPTPSWSIADGRFAGWYSDKPTPVTPCRVLQGWLDGLPLDIAQRSFRAVLSQWTDEVTARRHAVRVGGVVETSAAA